VACSFFAFCSHSFPFLLSTFFPFSAIAYACKLLCLLYASFHFCSAPLHSGLSVVFFRLVVLYRGWSLGVKTTRLNSFFAISFSFVRSLIRSRRHFPSSIVTWPPSLGLGTALRIAKDVTGRFCVAEHPTNCILTMFVFLFTALLDYAYLRDCCCFRDARSFIPRWMRNAEESVCGRRGVEY
jgi:hypothetical protein